MFSKGALKSKVILFCGLSNVGKTTILNIFTKGDVFKTAPTLGISLSTLAIKDMNFRIFDLGGQDRFRDEITSLLPFTDIIVFVVDASDKKRFNEVQKELTKILENTKLRLTPICILHNKSDLKKKMSIKYITDNLGLKSIINRPWKIISTSAVTLVGLKELFIWIYELSTGEKLEFKIEKKEEKGLAIHYPCPLKREMEDGNTYCLNQDKFIETQITYFGNHENVTKMILQVLPDLRKESLKSTGKDICPDFCILKKKEAILRCPVTNLQIETRGIKVSIKRYEDAVVIAQIYGAKIGVDICRDCIYKIIISPETILSDEELKEFSKALV